MHDFSYSDTGLQLTKQFEGLRLDAYQDCAGVWTIGYGHTGRDVKPGQRVTPLEAEVLLHFRHLLMTRSCCYVLRPSPRHFQTF